MHKAGCMHNRYRIIARILCLAIFALSFNALTASADDKEGHLPSAYQHAGEGVKGENGLFPPTVDEIEDSQLKELMKKMFLHNNDLRQMMATIRRLRSEYASSRSALYPRIDLNATLGATSIQNSGNRQNHSSYQVSIPVSYEIDAWKRLSALSTAALLKSEAAASDREALYVTLSAELMERYYSGLCLLEQLSLLNEAMQLAVKKNELLRYQYELGLISKDDLYPGEQRINKISASRAYVKAELSRTEHALKVLTGEYPEDGWLKGGFSVPEWLRYVPEGLPSDLLQRRPDLRSLKLQIVSAGYSALAAKRSRLPTFKLIGQGQTGSDQLENLATDTSPSSSPSFGVFLQMSFPIFDGHRNKAEYEAKIYAQEELTEEHKQTLLTAFSEVENALSAGEEQENAVEAIRERNMSMEREVAMVETQYKEGIKDMLKLVTEKEDLVFAKIELQNEELSFISYRIQLIRSLGGYWWKNEELPQSTIH